MDRRLSRWERIGPGELCLDGSRVTSWQVSGLSHRGGLGVGLWVRPGRRAAGLAARRGEAGRSITAVVRGYGLGGVQPSRHRAGTLAEARPRAAVAITGPKRPGDNSSVICTMSIEITHNVTGVKHWLSVTLRGVWIEDGEDAAVECRDHGGTIDLRAIKSP